MIIVVYSTIGLLRIVFRKDLIDKAVKATLSSIGIYLGAKIRASLGIVGGLCGFLIGVITGGIAGGISGYLAPKTNKVVRGICKYFGFIF